MTGANSPGEDSDQKDPDKVAPDQEDPDKFNPNKVDLDAVITLAAASFTSKTFSPQALSLISSCFNKLGRSLTNGPLVALHVPWPYSSSPGCFGICFAIAIGLAMEHLQLVVATNEEVPSTTIAEHLDNICSTLKRLFDTKSSFAYAQIQIPCQKQTHERYHPI